MTIVGAIFLQTIQLISTVIYPINFFQKVQDLTILRAFAVILLQDCLRPEYRYTVLISCFSCADNPLNELQVNHEYLVF